MNQGRKISITKHFPAKIYDRKRKVIKTFFHLRKIRAKRGGEKSLWFSVTKDDLIFLPVDNNKLPYYFGEDVGNSMGVDAPNLTYNRVSNALQMWFSCPFWVTFEFMKRCQHLFKWASPLLGLQMRFHQLLTLVIKQKRVLNYSLLNWHCWRVVDTRKVWVIFHFGSLTSKARRRRRSLYRNHI